MKIGIYTTQLPELTTAGGIGNVTSRLAKELSLAGITVEIVTARTEIPLNPKIQAEYESFGVSVRELQRSNVQTSPWWLHFQREALQDLSANDYDICIAQEWQAPLGLIAGSTNPSIPVLSWLHGGTLYDHLGSQKEFSSQFQLVDSYLDQIQVENSTLVVSPSKFLVNFYSDYGWKMPKVKYVPYHLPKFDFNNTHANQEVVRLAFVSALSSRKGFDSALSLVKKLKESGLIFEFGIYGKFMDIDKEDIVKYLDQHAISYFFKQDLHPLKIWRELSERNTTVLLPSRLDNSPSVAYEGLAASCKILTSVNQGTMELKEYFPHHIHIWDDTRVDLMRNFVQSPPLRVTNIHEHNQKVTSFWVQMFDEILSTKEGSQNALKLNYTEATDGISLILITKDRPDFFVKALQSAIDQTLKPSEIIVIEDVTNGPTSVYKHCLDMASSIPIKYVPIDYSSDRNAFNAKTFGDGQAKAARSRNLGAELAKFNILAFLDDDNIFYPQHLARCYEAMLDGKLKAVTPFLAQVFSNDPLSLGLVATQIAIMAGNKFGTLNTLVNVCMDSHILIDRELFQSVGGFPVEAKPEDWGLGLRLIAIQAPFGTTSEATVLYRLNLDGIQAQLTAASKSWIRLNKEISLVSQEFPQSFLQSQLAMAAFEDKAFTTTIRDVQRSYYFHYALRLVRERNFKQLIFGIRKFIQRSFPLR